MAAERSFMPSSSHLDNGAVAPATNTYHKEAQCQNESLDDSVEGEISTNIIVEQNSEF